MAYHVRIMAVVMVLLASLLAAPGLRAQEVTDEAVAARIQVLTDSLVAKQQGDGSWNVQPSYPVGSTALVLLALKHAGLPATHPAVQKAVAFITANADSKVYSEGLVLCALEQVDPKANRARMEKAADFLIKAQSDVGVWSYGGKGGGGDNSNAQFAVLGLASANRCGIRVPVETISRAVNYWRKAQNNDSGWAYRAKQDNSTLSMTCAGMASLFLLGQPYESPEPGCGQYSTAKELESGLTWYDRAFTPEKMANNPGLMGGHWAYTLYAMERVGMLLQRPTFGNLDWYRFGAAMFLKPGMDRAGLADQSFALLFLAKAANPLAVAKWRWSGDWDEDKHDVRAWTEAASAALGKPLDYVEAPLDRLDSPAARASLIFVNGHQIFTLKPEELTFLRSFLHEGKGTLVAEACCNNQAFAANFKRELATRLEPNLPGVFVPISAGHPIYRSLNQLSPADIRISELKVPGCRKVRVFFLEQDISCSLNGGREVQDPRRREMAGKIAVNLLAFALQSKQPQGKLNRFGLNPEAAAAADLSADQVRAAAAGVGAAGEVFGRLKHKGDSRVDPNLFRVLKKALATDPRFPAFDREEAMEPGGADIFRAPVLFLAGHEDPALDEKEMLNLRTWIQNGGTLVVSSCCTRAEFDAGFRRLAARLFPNDKLEEIPRADPVFKRPLVLAGVPAKGTKAFDKAYNGEWPPLLGVRREARWAILYSPVDFCCGIEGDQDPEVVSFNQESGLPLLINLLCDAMGVETRLREGAP